MFPCLLKELHIYLKDYLCNISNHKHIFSQTVQHLHSLHSVSVVGSLGHRLLFFGNMVVFTPLSESSVHKQTG